MIFWRLDPHTKDFGVWVKLYCDTKRLSVTHKLSTSVAHELSYPV